MPMHHVIDGKIQFTIIMCAHDSDLRPRGNRRQAEHGPPRNTLSDHVFIHATTSSLSQRGRHLYNQYLRAGISQHQACRPRRHQRPSPARQTLPTSRTRLRNVSKLVSGAVCLQIWLLSRSCHVPHPGSAEEFERCHADTRTPRYLCRRRTHGSHSKKCKGLCLLQEIERCAHMRPTGPAGPELLTLKREAHSESCIGSEM